MSTETTTSDVGLLDILRKSGALSVAQLATAMDVTATAVRQRLVRLLAQGDIERTTERTSRGRPVHRYGLTEKGRRRAGANFADLATALWDEMRAIQDPEVRRGLLARISGRMASLYAGQIRGSSLDERMQSLAELFRQRQIPFDVEWLPILPASEPTLAASATRERSRELPVLHARACPYPELAEKDRSVCAMEKNLFSELLGENVRLSNCRLDGHDCCTFEPQHREDDTREGDAPAEPRLGRSLALPQSLP